MLAEAESAGLTLAAMLSCAAAAVHAPVLARRASTSLHTHSAFTGTLLFRLRGFFPSLALPVDCWLLQDGAVSCARSHSIQLQKLSHLKQSAGLGCIHTKGRSACNALLSEVRLSFVLLPSLTAKSCAKQTLEPSARLKVNL